jgi:N-acetylmuramoyl-L-alanine amidase
MLLDVQATLRNGIVALGGVLLALLGGVGLRLFAQAPTQTQPPQTTQAPTGQSTPAQSNTTPPGTLPPQAQTQGGGLTVVVVDPAHGGTDPGARGAGGMRESDLVLEYAVQARKSLEAQGFQVRLTRQGNDNPSFDDRSAMANAQRGTVFVTLHVASTGSPGTVRVYTMTDFPAVASTTGLIPWDRAQAPFLELSHQLGNLVQGQLTLQFKGSPNTEQSATLRQLRTTAAPAIAVEVSSILVEDPAELARMGTGIADAIARGVAAFRPIYDASAVPGAVP